MAGIAVKPDNGVGVVVAIRDWMKMPLALALLTIAVLLVGCSDDNAPLVKGQPMPGFSLQNLQGDTVHFPTDFEHHVVLISFWADWCPSCKKEMHDFEAIFQESRKQGFAILAINIAQEREQAIAFIGDLDLSYEVLLDANGEVAKTYAVSAIPSIFIVDRDGNLHTRILGEIPAENLEKALAPLLRGSLSIQQKKAG